MVSVVRPLSTVTESRLLSTATPTSLEPPFRQTGGCSVFYDRPRSRTSLLRMRSCRTDRARPTPLPNPGSRINGRPDSASFHASSGKSICTHRHWCLVRIHRSIRLVAYPSRPKAGHRPYRSTGNSHRIRLPLETTASGRETDKTENVRLGLWVMLRHNICPRICPKNPCPLKNIANRGACHKPQGMPQNRRPRQQPAKNQGSDE